MTSDGRATVASVITRYSFSNIYRWALSVLNAFIRPKLLPPELFGLWNLLTLITDYASYSDLGSGTSMRYLVPFHESRNEHRKSVEIRSTVYHGTLYVRMLVSAVLVLIALTADLNKATRVGILTIALINGLQWYEEYYLCTLKSYQQFILVAHGNYVRTSVSVLFGAALMYFYGIYGLYAAAVCSCLGVIGYFRARYPMAAPGAFHRGLYAHLVTIGAPIVLFNLFMIVIRTSDRIIVASFLGAQQLGYYGIASTALSFLLQIPGVSREVLEPRLMEVVGTESREQTMREYFFKPLVNTAYLMPFLVGAFFVTLPVVVTRFLPRYTPGIVPTQIELLGGYFLALALMTRGLIVAHKWQLKSLGWLALALAVNVLLSVLFLSRGFGLVGVALSSSISFLTLFLGLLHFVKARSGCSSRLWRESVLPLCWPFPLMCATLAGLEALFHGAPLGVLFSAAAKLILYTAVMALFFLLAQRRTPLLKGIRLSEVA